MRCGGGLESRGLTMRMHVSVRCCVYKTSIHDLPMRMKSEMDLDRDEIHFVESSPMSPLLVELLGCSTA